MRTDFFKKVLAKANKWRGQKPLMSHDSDMRLLRQARGSKLPTLRQFFHLTKILSPQERVLFRVSLAVFVVSFLWFGQSVLANYRVAVPDIGGSYVEAVVGSPQLINPVFAPLNDVDTDISRLVYSGLMRMDKKQRLVPDLAASSTISEDKKVYTFRLREDVLWHDGEKFTAEDVVYTIQTIQNPAVGSPLLVSFQNVAVEAVDEFTVKFTLQEPFSPFLSSLTVGILPEHVWFDIAPERMQLAQKNLQPTGTGPFKFKKLLKDESGYIYKYELERFENYYRQPPFIQDFAFQFFSEYAGDSGAINRLRQQNVDGIHFVPVDLREQANRKHINIYTLQLPQYTALFFNQKRQTALEDNNLRTALAVALDKDRILREAIGGEGQVIYSPILPGFPGYNPEMEKTAYSVEKANEMLDKEWSRFGAEEYRQLRKGELVSKWLEQNPQPVVADAEPTEESQEDIDKTVESASLIPAEVDSQFEAQLDQEINPAQTFYRRDDADNLLELKLVTTDTEEYKHAAEQIAGFWQEIGIKTILEFVPAKDFSRQVLKERSYDVLLYGVIIGSEPDQFPFWHSTQVDFPGLNLSGYANRTVDGYLESAREATEEDKIIEAYQQFQDAVIKDRPAIFLYMPTYTYALNEKVLGVDLSRIFNPADRFADVTNWYIKTDSRWMFGK